MASRGQALTIQYVAWDTAVNQGKTGDGANHTLRWIKDGVAAAPTNTPTEIDVTNAPGVYALALTAAECSCWTGMLAGKSSTAAVSIIPMTITFEQLPIAPAGSENGLPIVDANNHVAWVQGVVTNLDNLAFLHEGLFMLGQYFYDQELVPSDLLAIDGESTPAFTLRYWLQMIDRGNAQAATPSTITLSPAAPATDNHYPENGAIVHIYSGPGTGQTRFIRGYNGTSKVLDIFPNWNTLPTSASWYLIVPGQTFADLYAAFNNTETIGDGFMAMMGQFFANGEFLDSRPVDIHPLTAQAIADVILKRGAVHTEDTADLNSLTELILAAFHANTTANPGELTILQTDDVTEFNRHAIVSDPAAEPITGVAA